MCLCYLGALETLDFTKEEGSRLDPRPPPLNLDTYRALSLTLSLALERGYPRANITPLQCLWRIQLYLRVTWKARPTGTSGLEPLSKNLLCSSLENQEHTQHDFPMEDGPLRGRQGCKSPVSPQQP